MLVLMKLQKILNYFLGGETGMGKSGETMKFRGKGEGRETETERDRDRDRQTDRQTETDREIQSKTKKLGRLAVEFVHKRKMIRGLRIHCNVGLCE